MRVRRLKGYRIAPASAVEGSSEGAGWWIWVDGSQGYAEKLREAFANVDLDVHQNARSPRFSWCARLQDVTEETLREIRRCLHLFSRTLWIENELSDDCFALGWHSRAGSRGKPDYTALGQWVHAAKSYGSDPDSRGSVTFAGLIADQMVEFISRHPLYRCADAVVSVLPSNPDKTFDLPFFLAQRISEDNDITHLRYALYKKRRTAPMKYCLTLEDKWDNISGSVGVRTLEVAGKALILVDDIYESGVTLTETARALRESRVGCLRVLVATKTLKTNFR